MPPFPREIVDEQRLRAELSKCGVSPKKLDDVIAGLRSTIAARPEVFQREEQSGLSRIIIREFLPDIPAIRIWFTFDEAKVYIEAVELLSMFL